MARARQTCENRMTRVDFHEREQGAEATMTLEEWRARVAELRDLAAETSDASRKRRYLELADRWSEFAEELENSGADIEPERAVSC